MGTPDEYNNGRVKPGMRDDPHEPEPVDDPGPGFFWFDEIAAHRHDIIHEYRGYLIVWVECSWRVAFRISDNSVIEDPRDPDFKPTGWVIGNDMYFSVEAARNQIEYLENPEYREACVQTALAEIGRGVAAGEKLIRIHLPPGDDPPARD
jgi:hypothetical protein